SRSEHKSGVNRKKAAMKDDSQTRREEGNAYLWDGSGPADPEVRQLENLLVSFKHDGRPPAFLHALPTETPTSARYQLQRIWLSAFACATIVLLSFVASLILKRATPSNEQTSSGWDVAQIEGAPRIDRNTLREGQRQAKLAVGQTLETNATSRASLSATDLGQ